ncbi:MAG: hypothetical protein NDF54_10485, partial [archaeon GB-1867-035]|nr:hypothetical protein [Candidatus Culexmicrobium profundum]
MIYVSKEIRKHHLIERVYKAKPIYVRVLLSMKARKQIRNIVLDVLDILEEKFDVKIKGDKREIADKVA